METARLSPVVTFYVPFVLLGLTIFLALREWRLYRAPDMAERDLFPATRARLVRRWTGSAILFALAITLASMGRWPPDTAPAAARYLNLLAAEVVLLFGVFLLDVWALGRRRPRR
jgi:hypothetical protein